jgi:hypothetical protein
MLGKRTSCVPDNRGDGKQPRKRALPFSSVWAVAAGALLGIALRLVYSGGPDGAYAAMSSGFIYLAPVVVGAVTAFVAEHQARRSLAYHIAASSLANILFVVGTMAILIEGLICAVVILPLFIVLGVMGAGLMLVVCRLTNWPKPTVGCLVLLPLLLGHVDSGVTLTDSIAEVERSIVVAAPPVIVWQELLNTDRIRPEELEHAWVFRIGAPLPLEGRMLPDAAQPIRRVRMAKNVYFDEVIEEQRANGWIRWTYRFHPDSFPPYAFDEHVVIGGRYFDVRDTSYELTPIAEGTHLRVTLGYRISTRFNWYAAPVARWLLGNLADSNLAYYRLRSELAANGE